MIQTINNIMQLRPLKIALAHFGVINLHTTPRCVINRFKEIILEYAQITLECKGEIIAIELALWNLLFDDLAKLNLKLTQEDIRAIFSLDIGLNAQGLHHYYTRLTRSGSIKR
ncbi:hypothetical protein AwWohl_00530 [Gammaproteobacteria bacterium]|nr:hypothetical protein AwWohl_00530 [Gammaproteobacteria bacterium]